MHAMSQFINVLCDFSKKQCKQRYSFSTGKKGGKDSAATVKRSIHTLIMIINASFYCRHWSLKGHKT
jgi:hypothetical protein